MLGIQGNKAFKRGADWREYMRNWTAPQNTESRISGLLEKNLFLPTDTFIASIAQKYGVPYTKGKKGEDRFYSDEGKPIYPPNDGRPIYPPNDGAVGTPKTITLKAGTVIDRYGWPMVAMQALKGCLTKTAHYQEPQRKHIMCIRLLKTLKMFKQQKLLLGLDNLAEAFNTNYQRKYLN